MTLLIVEDDEIIREALEKSISWQEYGIRIVGSAGDGQEGLTAAHTLKPDLVLSDIRMPLLDGLEMARQLRADFPDIRFVFLTAYTEFEYVKKALDLRGASYVVKSGDNDEIVSAVTGMAAELATERSVQEKAREGEPLLKTRFFNDLINGSIPSDRIATRQHLLGFTFAEGYRCAAVFATGNSIEGPAPMQVHGQMEKLSCILQEYWNAPERQQRPVQSFFFVSGYNDICVLVIGAEDINGKKDYFYCESVKILEKELHTSVYCGVGNSTKTAASVAESYTQAIAVLHARQLSGPDHVLFYQTIRDSDINQCLLLDDLYAYINENYWNNALSLADVSGKMHISPTYLCTLLKKYRKTTFITRLSQVRMEQAKELLKKTELKTYEIADRVGYANSQYFSTLFKKYAGVTPSGYREGEKSL